MTGELLAHEQGHFDIAELAAKRLKRDLKVRFYSDGCHDTDDDAKNLAYSRLVKYTKLAIKVANTEDAYAQKQYDDQTDHGLNESEQNRWNTNIGGQMRSQTAVADVTRLGD